MYKYTDADKINAISVLREAAKLYNQYFCNKKLLVIHDNLLNPCAIEVTGTPTGFLHLTGAKVNIDNLLQDVPDKETNYRIVFYEKCLNNKLSIYDFDFDNKGETERKLKVISTALNPQNNAKMIGDYNEQRIYFKSDKLMGSESSYLGLFKDKKGYYAVGSVINGDIRDDVKHVGISPITSKIFMILSKGFSDKCYNEIISISKYKGKKIDVQDLLKKISKDYPISQDLLDPSSQDDPSLKKRVIEENEENPDNKEQEKDNKITNVSEMPKSQSGDKLEAPPKRLTLDEHLAQARAAKQAESTSFQKNEQCKSKKHEDSLD